MIRRSELILNGLSDHEKGSFSVNEVDHDDDDIRLDCIWRWR